MSILSYAQKLKSQVTNFFWPEETKFEPLIPKHIYALAFDKAPMKCASVRVKRSKAIRTIRRHKRQQRYAI